MGKVVQTFETEYDKGEVVVFYKYQMDEKKRLEVGIIESYYVEDGNIWYTIRGMGKVWTYSDGGDVAESSILGKLDDALAKECSRMIIKGEFCW